jgi:hypothetical protein
MIMSMLMVVVQDHDACLMLVELSITQTVSPRRLSALVKAANPAKGALFASLVKALLQ